MTRISTGTPEAHSEHTTGASALGTLFAVGVPAAIGIGGIAVLGWNAISWAGAAAWGVAGAVAFWIFHSMMMSMSVTRLDIFELLGSFFATPKTAMCKGIGFIVHLVDGAVLGIVFAYGIQLGRLQSSWLTGWAWGVLLWGLSLLLLTNIGGIHPAIRNHREGDPGPAAGNFGKTTPVAMFIGHSIYGAALGVLYFNWPNLSF
ncbi:MAG TPA: hypothetical protein VFV23_11895 [Verrucomicrobiae bacterium]|nr:hypothetical protein [Verrucomicrobiae bacterium]